MKFSISSITITNFRQYRGTHTLNFTQDDSKNVSVVLGKNGAGKSNILNALTWCLYGIEIHKSNDKTSQNGMPIINAAALNSLEINQNTCAEVIVYMKTDTGSWTIIRRVEGKKEVSGERNVELDGKLTIVHNVDGQDKITEGEGTQQLINNLLPEALKSFFFIDGEQLREFFKISTPQKIAKAIDIVSQLELVYEASEHLDWYEKLLKRNVKVTTPNLKKIRDEIDSLDNRKGVFKDKIEEEKKSNDKDNEELIKVKNYLKEHANLNVSNLEKERQSIENDMKNLNRHITIRESERNAYLVNIAPFIYMKKELNKTYDIINNNVEKGLLPSQIKENFVRELIEKGRCICGNDLTGDARKVLEEYSKNLSLSELSEISLTGKTTILDILSDIEDFPEKIDGFGNEIDDLKDQLGQKVMAKKEISEKIQAINISDVKRNEARRDELIELITKSDQLLKVYKNQLQILERNLHEKNNELVKELAKDKKNILFRTKHSLVKDALAIFAETEYIIKTKIRKEVEKNTENNFSTLIRKKAAFEGINIDDQYRVEVLHSEGYNAINDLSAGEYLILGLSFMSALMTISGFQAPVIIDTPFAKIDDEHREYITKELPKFLYGTQIILLVTPTEYDENVKLNLDKYLLDKNFYEIHENQTETESWVVQNVN